MVDVLVFVVALEIVVNKIWCHNFLHFDTKQYLTQLSMKCRLLVKTSDVERKYI